MTVKVLWFNWRDIKNPAAGGAEVLTHEVMKRLAKKNHYEMTLFTAQFPNCLETENVDGITIIRSGNRYTVYYKAISYYKKYKDKYDLIIDEINIKPFLTPKFVKGKPIIALIHEVAGEALFYQQLHFPINYIVYHYFIKKWLSYYKHILTVTVSSSSKKDLEELNFKNILVVSEGLSIKPLSQLPRKETNPTIVFLGRLKKYKRPDHALHAFSLLKNQFPDARMWIIGDGPMRRELEKIKVRDVTLYGYVKDELKYQLLSKAHVVLLPSVNEGWGLVVNEANSMGTPVVAYDVPGLRDSVRNGETGLLVKENSPECLARSVIFLLKNHDILSKLSINALAYSRQFNWDNTGDRFDQIIKDTFSSFYISEGRTATYG